MKEAILGFLDVRDGKPVIYGKQGSRVEVSGWAACGKPGVRLVKVVLLVDGTVRGETQEFFPRPDVAAAYGRQDFELSGWRTSVDLVGAAAGEHILTARGVAGDGTTGELPSFRLRIFE